MDYASAAPVQPIVQGRVFFPLGPGPGTPVAFDGKGVVSIVRGAQPQGFYLLTLDEGLIGNAGAVPAGPVPPLDPDARTLITPIGVGVPPLSGVIKSAVAYITSPAPGVGATVVSVAMTSPGGVVGVDPTGGFYIVVWRGQGVQGLVP